MTDQTDIHNAKTRAKTRKRKLLPELAAQLDATLATLLVLMEQVQAVAGTVAVLADADTVNDLANHWLVEDDDGDAA